VTTDNVEPHAALRRLYKHTRARISDRILKLAGWLIEYYDCDSSACMTLYEQVTPD
jgi:hypothetical protein